jgi:tRNA dimethylallyltransferase
VAQLERDGLPPLIVIAGATATGKTRLSLELAARTPGAEIISADSRQVYRGMDIGTAKVSAADRARVPHHGLDLVDPDESFTAADFRAYAMDTLRGIAARRGVAILVGGTGLYIQSVARGVPLEESGHAPEIRSGLEARLAGEGLPGLVAELKRVAPGVASSIDLANPRRVVRALERVSVHGDRPPPEPRGYPGTVTWHILDPDPAAHARWIGERAKAQFDNGLLEEAAVLRARYPEDLRAFSAVGYREAFDVLADRSTVDEAVARTILRTRQYAKRQRTWFRGVER